MAGLPIPGAALPRGGAGWRGWRNRLIASRRFQKICARIPGLSHHMRAEGAALFDIMAGFVNAQMLAALVELRVLHHLADAPMAAAALTPRCGLAPERMQILLQAGAALGLTERLRDGRFALAARGVVLISVPGLEAMVRHHDVLYRDLADPAAFLRGETDPGLARFWPYVFGAAAAEDPETAARYSGLMADSQGLVAEDTLRLVDLRGVRELLDVGGGTGAFLAAVGAAHPRLRLALFDLPAVVAGAGARMAAAGLTDRCTIHPGSFRDDALPRGADAISLIRVLYDHTDDTVARLLSRVHDALPPGGRIVISEPMSGGNRPDRATDLYFAVYTLAMQTGRTRSAAEISDLLQAAGFVEITRHPGMRPYVTSALTARKPA